VVRVNFIAVAVMSGLGKEPIDFNWLAKGWQ
jgi:hypothetical protein